MISRKKEPPAKGVIVFIADTSNQPSSICDYLIEEGYSLSIYTSADLALNDFTNSELPLLIITNIYLHGIDGFRFCRLLRSQEYKKYNATPILVVSAFHDGAEPARIVRELNANAFLPLPLEKEKFLSTVRSLVEGKIHSTKTRVLIVESDEVSTREYKTVFESHSMDVVICQSLKSARKKLERQNYEIAIIAHQLPDGSGGDLLQEVRTNHPETICLMITSDERPELATTWMRLGAAAYLRKPFDPEYLLTLCENAQREHALLSTQQLLETRTKELVESESVFRNAMEATRDGMWKWNLTTNEVYYSPAYFEMLGYKASDFSGRVESWLDLLHPEDRDITLEENFKCINNEIPSLFVEYRMRAKDGSWHWVLCRGHALKRDENGIALEMIGTTVDMTLQKELENSIHQKEEYYRRIISTTQDGFWVVGNRGQFVDINDAYCRMSGYTREEFLQLGIKDIDVLENETDTQNRIQKIIAAGSDFFVTKHRRKDGSVFDVEVTVNFLDLDEGLFVCFCRDITERLRNDTALRDSEEKYRLLHETAGIGVGYYTPEGVVISYNQLAARHMGGNPQEFYGRSIFELFPKEEAEVYFDRIVRSAASNEPMVYNDPINLPTGVYWFESTFTSIKNETGSVIGVQIISQDITERKNYEEALRQSEERFRKLSEDLPSCVCSFLPDSQITYGNSALASYLDTPFSELIGKKYLDLIDPAQKSIVEERIQKLTPQYPFETHEEVHIQKDGETKFFEWRNRGFFDEDGKPIYYLGVGVNITKRRKAEMALQMEKESLSKLLSFSENLLEQNGSGLNYQQIVDQLTIISGAKYVVFNLFEENGKDFQTVAISSLAEEIKKASQLLGFELIGKRWPQDDELMKRIKKLPFSHYSSLVELAGGVLRKSSLKMVEKMFQVGEVVIMTIATSQTILGDFTIIMPAGVSFTAEETVSIYTRQVGLTLQRINAEALLRDSEKNFRTFFETIDDIIVVAKPEGNILYGNSALVKKLGFTQDELKEMTVIDLHPIENRQDAEEIFKAMFRGERVNCPLPLVTKKGALIPVETRVWSGQWNGEDCIFGVYKDLSAEQEAQQRFERIFHSNPNPMGLTSLPERKFTNVNEAFLKMLGYARQEVIGKTTLELGLFPQSEEQQEVAKTLAIQGKIQNFELQVKAKDGRLLDGLFSGEVIESQGRKSFLTVMVDITERKQMQKELQQSHNLLDYIIEHNRSAVAVHDRDMRYIYVSQRYLDDYKIKETNIIGKGHYEVFPDLPQKWRDVHQRVLKGEVLSAEDDPYYREDGTVEWTRWECRPWYESKGSIGGLIVYTEVISDRKKIEQQIIQEKEKAQKYLDIAAVMMVAIDINGTITMINKKGLEILGYDDRGLVGKNWFETCIPPEQREMVARVFKDIVDGKVKELAYYENFIVTRSGERRIIGWHNTIITDDKGKFVASLSSGEDITERKKMAEDLKVSEERYRLIDEASQDLIYSYDLESRFTHANSTLCELLQLPEQAICGKTHRELGFPEEQCAEWDLLHRQVIETRQGLIKETITPIQGSSPKYFEVVLNPIFNEHGDVIGIAGTTRDINDRKKAEEKIQAQLTELRHWHKLTLGREDRIMELKREVNDLLASNGKPIRYPSVHEEKND